jgi:hypothetical protein
MNPQRLHELIDAWRDGSLTEATAAELSQALRDSDEARRIFRAEAQMHGLLHQAVSAQAVEEAANRAKRLTPPVAAEGGRTTRWLDTLIPFRRLLFAGAGGLVLCLVAATIWISTAPSKRPVLFATLTRATNCVWEGRTPPLPGDSLAPGALRLNQGIAEIKLANGIDLLIEAPAHIELIDLGHSVLKTGRIVARVPPMGRGYAVDTPKARFVDLGTEFGISVGSDRGTVAQVFDGVVVAELKKPDASGKRTQRIVAGETVRIDAANRVELQKTAPSYERFLRTFSRPSVYEGDELIPFKPSQIAAVEVVPASRPVTIDGDLSDWDLSSRFEARCAEPFAKSYYVQGAMMYDAQYLYIAARVGDPMPMRNVIDPNIDPWSAWMGGGLHLHFCTDRTFGWPLKAEWWALDRQPSAQDNSDRIVHLFLWYFQPREQACVGIRYGMRMERGVVNPPGWKGAFRKAPDGRSYTLECAVPWTLLGAGSDPPRAGDVLGLSWRVEWSDGSGRRWKGQLVEIKNPPYADRGKDVMTFMNAEAWGKAIYR